MKDSNFSNKKEKKKINQFFPDTNKKEQNKQNKKENSKKRLKKEREKEKNGKKSKEISENIVFIKEKNEQSKEIFFNNICKNEKFIVTEISKTFMVMPTEEKFFEYSKKGKNKEQKNDEYNNLEEDNSQEKETKNYHIKIDEKFNKKDKYEKESNIDLENGKKEKLKLGKNKEKIQASKKGNIEDDKDERNIYESQGYNKFYKKYYIDDFIKNKHLPDDLNIKRRYIKKNKDKYNQFYFIYFYFFTIYKILFLQFINCNHRKIEFASSYIKLKTKGTDQIKILNYNYFLEYKPNIISVNNNINYTNNEINNNDLDNEINNITIIWENPPESAYHMFSDCGKIIEIEYLSFS